MTQRTASERAAENARKEIYAQSELMRQQEKLNQGDFYAPTNYERGVNSGGGVFSFGQDFGSPYRTDTLNDLKQTVPTVSPYELGEADLITAEENIQDAGVLTQQYYDNVDKLNFLAKEAASQGWNITQMNFRDPNKRALSEAYQQLKAQTLDLGNTLKGGYEVQQKGMEDNRLLEREGMDTGYGTEHVFTTRDLVSSDMFHNQVAEMNKTLAKELDRATSKNEYNKILDRGRAYFKEKESYYNSIGDTQKARLAREAHDSLGKASQNLEQEKLDLDRLKYTYGKRQDTALGSKLIDDTRLFYDERNYEHVVIDGKRRYINRAVSGQFRNENGVIDYIEYDNGKFIGHYKSFKTKSGESIGEDGKAAELPPFQIMLNDVATTLYKGKAAEAIESVDIIQRDLNDSKGYGVYDSQGRLDPHFKIGTFSNPNQLDEDINVATTPFESKLQELGSKYSGANDISYGEDDPTKGGMPFFSMFEDSDGRAVFQSKRNKIMKDYHEARKSGKTQEELDKILNGQGDLKGSVMPLNLDKKDFEGTDLSGYEEVFVVGSTDSGGGVHLVGMNQDGNTEKIVLEKQEKSEGYPSDYVSEYFKKTGLTYKLPEVSTVINKENQALGTTDEELIRRFKELNGQDAVPTEEDMTRMRNANRQSASQQTTPAWKILEGSGQAKIKNQGGGKRTWE